MQKEILLPEPILSSLVVNKPYHFDMKTTSPKISKVFSLPFGFRADALTIYNTCFKLISSLSVFLLISSIFITSLCLSVKAQNNFILNVAKSFTNRNFALQARLYELTSFTRLYEHVNDFSLKDSPEIIRVPDKRINLNSQAHSVVLLKPYPTLQFSGF